MNLKINILFVIVQMKIGGSERLVHTLVKKLDRGYFNPSVAWFYGDNILKEFADLQVPLYHVPKIKKFDFSTMKTLADIIKYNNIHIVNAHHFMSMVYLFYGCKVRNKCKLIYTEHSEWEIERIPWRWKKIGGYLLKHVDGAVGVNSNVTERIRAEFEPPHALTIRNGVDLDAFSQSRNTPLKRELGIDDNEKVIGVVANFKKIKNHIFLLKAFRELVKNSMPVKLILVGQGFQGDPDNSEREIRDYVSEQGLNKNVLFLGYRPDISEILSIVDVFCLTSFKEGLPISLLEAMASGIPVVGADVEGIRDVIVGGKNGFLASLDDIEGLKDTLYMLLTDDSLRRKMGCEAKKMTTEYYSLNACLEQYQNLFMSVIRKCPA